MATLQDALQRFGVVTVMDAYVFPQGHANFSNPDASPELIVKLDTLRITNFTQEGPRKTAKGGLNAEVVMRYGKTARLEMEDVVGRIAALEALMGVRAGGSALVPVTINQGDVVKAQTVFLQHVPQNLAITAGVTALVLNTDYFLNGQYITFADAETDVVITYNYQTVESYKITDEFDGMYTIFGRTFIINKDSGEREYINIIIHKFLPDGLLNLTMESEGDFGVISLAGELFTNDCGVFYEFTYGTQPSGC